MKNPLCILLCCVLLGMSQTTWSNGLETPKKAVQAYYDAVFANDFPAAYALLSQSDQDTISYEDYIRRNYFDYPMLQYVNSLSSYKIGKIKTDQTGGSAMVTVSAPDGEDVNTFVARTYLAYGMNSMSADEALVLMLKLIKEQKFEPVKKIEDVLLVKDDEGWHIFFNWSQKERHLQMLIKAQELSRSQHIEVLLQAKDLYQEARRMPDIENSNDMFYVNELWEIDRKIERLQACIAKIEIRNVEVAVVKDVPADVHVVYRYKLYNHNEDVVNIAVVALELRNADGSAAFTYEERVPQRNVEQNKTMPATACRGRLPAEAAAKWDGADINVKVINVELY